MGLVSSLCDPPFEKSWLRSCTITKEYVIEAKNQTLKILKTALFDCVSMKNVAVLTKDGAFPFFFRPHPREFAIQGKKNANAWGQPGGGGWAQLELTDA